MSEDEKVRHDRGRRARRWASFNALVNGIPEFAYLGAILGIGVLAGAAFSLASAL